MDSELQLDNVATQSALSEDGWEFHNGHRLLTDSKIFAKNEATLTEEIGGGNADSTQSMTALAMSTESDSNVSTYDSQDSDATSFHDSNKEDVVSAEPDKPRNRLREVSENVLSCRVGGSRIQEYKVLHDACFEFIKWLMLYIEGKHYLEPKQFPQHTITDCTGEPDVKSSDSETSWDENSN